MKKKIKSILFVLSLLNIIVGILVLLLFSDGEKVDNIMVPGEIIVQYKYSSFLTKNHRIVDNGLTCNDRPSIEKNSEDFLKENHFEIKSVLSEKVDGNIALLQIKDNKSIEDSIKLLYEDSNIEIIEPNNYINCVLDTEKNNILKGKLITTYARFNNSRIQTEYDYNFEVLKTHIDGLEINDPKGSYRSLAYIGWANAYLKYKNLLEKTDPVIVGVIDDGVNYNHIDLKDSMRTPSSCYLGGNLIECVHGYDFGDNDSIPLPQFETHGTSVAGIIAAQINNGKGIVGVNPYAKIAALKGRSTYDFIEAFEFAKENGIKIINISIGGFYSDLEKQAIKEYGDAGGLVIAPAGNDNIDIDLKEDLDDFSKQLRRETYPCAYDLDNIICVGGLAKNGGRVFNYGKYSVDISAPGASLVTTSTDYSTGFLVYDNSHSSFSDNFVSHIYSMPEKYDKLVLRFMIRCYNDRGINDSSYNMLFFDSLGNDITNYKYINKFANWGNHSAVEVFNIPSGYKDFYFKIENTSEHDCTIWDLGIYAKDYDYGPESDYYEGGGGTSLATPHVAGLASLIWMLKPDLTPLEVKNLILENGDDNENFKGYTVSGKTINVKKTLDALGLDVPEPWSPFMTDKGEGYKINTEENNNNHSNTHDASTDASWYSYGPAQEIIHEGGYTREKVNAFNFAKRVGITTANNIDSANMEGELTRIALSKMISHFAINVVGLEPDTSKHYTYNDVSSALNDKYNNGPLLSYQLGIMGINVKRFRPYDTVTRAEFATVLSRMIYKITDGYGSTKYYEPHINKLKQEGILKNADPNRIEKRGLAMLMLLRVAIINNYIPVIRDEFQ